MVLLAMGTEATSGPSQRFRKCACCAVSPRAGGCEDPLGVPLSLTAGDSSDKDGGRSVSRIISRLRLIKPAEHSGGH